MLDRLDQLGYILLRGRPEYLMVSGILTMAQMIPGAGDLFPRNGGVARR